MNSPRDPVALICRSGHSSLAVSVRSLSLRPSHLLSRSVTLLWLRRNVHASTYDKNIDDHVRPSVVPDYVIDTNSDKYWGPHPKTGVFGPANASVSGGTTDQYQSANSTSSVLDQKACFTES